MRKSFLRSSVASFMEFVHFQYMVSVNGLVNMHSWQLVIQLDIFSVTIQKLKEKASFRNSDEFYYKMIKSKTVGGVHKSE
ncbi:hypothetical protein IFM89_023552 [Coptis chinensis]|uniref:Uncharacterized protein n=1 Tax=Coptis chinensis TaxID=261450 RepID=A0A835M9B9_9MAGN|nr:hypothetical protein IFM89_023552 [Coptis chinensis]